MRELEELKQNIVAGVTSVRDVDKINEVQKYINELEERAEILSMDSGLSESYQEMIPCNIIIHNANIYIGEQKPPGIER